MKSGGMKGYLRFLRQALHVATEGSWVFYTWMFVLTAIALVGANAWAIQVRDGMVRTNMSDHVSWGLYIANFTFCVGLAAGGVMMVIPAYLYRDHDMHDVVIIGEILAIAAIVMSTLSVVVDLGRPDRFWHMIPGIGKFNWPISKIDLPPTVKSDRVFRSRAPRQSGHVCSTITLSSHASMLVLASPRWR